MGNTSISYRNVFVFVTSIINQTNYCFSPIFAYVFKPKNCCFFNFIQNFVNARGFVVFTFSQSSLYTLVIDIVLFNSMCSFFIQRHSQGLLHRTNASHSKTETAYPIQ